MCFSHKLKQVRICARRHFFFFVVRVCFQSCFLSRFLFFICFSVFLLLKVFHKNKFWRRRDDRKKEESEIKRNFFFIFQQPNNLTNQCKFVDLENLRWGHIYFYFGCKLLIIVRAYSRTKSRGKKPCLYSWCILNARWRSSHQLLYSKPGSSLSQICFYWLLVSKSSWLLICLTNVCVWRVWSNI